MVVLQSHPIWLAATQNWLHTRIASLPPSIHAPIVCEKTENVNAYPHTPLISLSEQFKLRFKVEYLARQLRLIRSLPCFEETCRTIAPQIIHSHFGNFGWRDSPVATKLGIKHIISFYGADVGKVPTLYPVWRKRYEMLFKTCTAVICEGPALAKQVVELGCPSNKVHVNALGINLEAITFTPREWRQGKLLQVLLASSFRPKKGISIALKALAPLAEEIPMHITIVGDAPNDAEGLKEKNVIHSTVHNCGLKEIVTFTGYVDNAKLHRLAREHHLFIQASLKAPDNDSEGGAPLSAIEMAASGIPVVATTHCDLPGVVVDGKTGFTAPENNVPGLTSAIQRMVENASHWPAITVAARKHIETHFNCRTQGQKLAELYQAIFEGKIL